VGNYAATQTPGISLSQCYAISQSHCHATYTLWEIAITAITAVSV